MSSTSARLPNALMCGTGEYTTGYTSGGQSKSDKKIGVVALTLFDLRRRGLVGKELSMVGTTGSKYPAIREHFAQNIAQVYKDMDCSFKGFPEGDKRDTEAYKAAIDALQPGDVVCVFVPDSQHAVICKYAIERKMHVLVTKPATKLLSDHQELISLAEKHGVLVMVEHHKRFDPAYSDAAKRSAQLGDLSYFYAYMSQPKNQLDTFKAWAGKESDISYYLNSHHVDILDWFCRGKAIPTKVTASAARGIATGEAYNCVEGTEDTITLLVTWRSLSNPSNEATAVFTASWAAPTNAGWHSDQGFHYVGQKGEIRVDQTRRGYNVVVDDVGNTFYNPFYMKYSPDENGYFDGQSGYGYVSIEKFIRAATTINEGKATPASFDSKLPTIKDTVLTTAILNAGRISLDEKRSVGIEKDGNGQWVLL